MIRERIAGLLSPVTNKGSPEKNRDGAIAAPSLVFYQKVILPYNWTERPPIVTPVI